MATAWRRCMGPHAKPLSSQAALNFLRHYKSMRTVKKRTSKKQRGGAAYFLGGASTDYSMGPGQAGNVQAAGFPVSAAFGPSQYGHFTPDVTNDRSLLNNVGGPAEIPTIAQTADCGVDRFPTDPSKAQVGAGYSRKNRSGKSRKNRSVKSRKNRSGKNRSGKSRKSRKTQRGGSNLLNFLGINNVSSGGMEPPIDTKGNIDHTVMPKYTTGTMFNVDSLSHLQGATPTNSIQSWAPAQFASASGQLFGNAQAAASS